MTDNQHSCEFCNQSFNSRTTAYRHRMKCKVEYEKKTLEEHHTKEIEMNKKLLGEIERNDDLQKQIQSLQLTVEKQSQQSQSQQDKINSLFISLSIQFLLFSL